MVRLQSPLSGMILRRHSGGEIYNVNLTSYPTLAALNPTCRTINSARIQNVHNRCSTTEPGSDIAHYLP